MDESTLVGEVAALKTQMQSLMGNHQEGIIAQYGKRLKSVEDMVLKVRTVFRVLLALAILVPWITGTSRFSLEKILERFGW